jgi:hypothetical protein
MMKIWRIICEWGIGCNEDLFVSQELAEQHVRLDLDYCGIDDTIEELKDEGLLQIYATDVLEN